MPPDAEGRPAGDRTAEKLRDDEDSTIILSPLVDLALELRPGIARTVAQSLVVEALDECADLLLCRDWAETRQRLYPAALRCAHAKHAGYSYAERRARELADAVQPRPGDYVGRWERRAMA